MRELADQGAGMVAEDRIRNHTVVVPGLGRVIEVSTFSQWLGTQEDREDEAGWFAQYWKSVTPGRVSSVTGIIRFLDKRLADALASSVAEEDLADLRRALSAVRDVAADYGQDQLADQAHRAGLRLIRPARAAQGGAEPISAPDAVGDMPEGAAASADALAGFAVLDRVEARLDAVEGMLTRTLERQDKIIELLSALVFPDSYAQGTSNPQYAGRHAAGQVTGDWARPDDPRRAPAAARYLKPDGGWDFEALFTATGLQSTLPE
jgi:hypothetical protein